MLFLSLHLGSMSDLDLLRKWQNLNWKCGWTSPVLVSGWVGGTMTQRIYVPTPLHHVQWVTSGCNGHNGCTEELVWMLAFLTLSTHNRCCWCHWLWSASVYTRLTWGTDCEPWYTVSWCGKLSAYMHACHIVLYDYIRIFCDIWKSHTQGSCVHACCCMMWSPLSAASEWLTPPCQRDQWSGAVPADILQKHDLPVWSELLSLGCIGSPSHSTPYSCMHPLHNSSLAYFFTWHTAAV